MKKNLSIITIILFLFNPWLISACELFPDEVIKVGCTYRCDLSYRFRVQLASMRLGYRVEFVDLPSEIDPITNLSLVDAVLVPGGADIDPKYYLDHVSQDLREYTQKNLSLVNYSKEGEYRDPIEYELVKQYSTNEKFKHLPLLGICRGMQMMSVVEGIPLYLDIKTELGIKNRYHKLDKVFISKDSSLMDSIFKRSSVRGYKFHHQGIRVPYYLENVKNYPNTRISAYSHDRQIAEALEYIHRPALGVQYHPEKSFSHAAGPIFRWFLTKACEYKKLRNDHQ